MSDRFSKTRLLADLERLAALAEKQFDFNQSDGRSQVFGPGVSADQLIEFGRYELLLDLILDYR